LGAQDEQNDTEDDRHGFACIFGDVLVTARIVRGDGVPLITARAGLMTSADSDVRLAPGSLAKNAGWPAIGDRRMSKAQNGLSEEG
jgi:hypothetical protein